MSFVHATKGMSKPAPDTPTTPATRKEKTSVYVYYQSHCPSCEWVSPDRRQMESDGWSDLTAHLRSGHGGQIREVRIRRTVIEEVIEQEQE